LLCLWPAVDSSVRETSLRAAACAWAIRSSLSSLQVPEIAGLGGLRVTMYISTGQLDLVILRAAGDRHHFLVKGEALSRIQSAVGMAVSDQVPLSPATCAIVHDVCTTAALARGWRGIKELDPQAAISHIGTFAVPETLAPIVRSFLSRTLEAWLSVSAEDRV